MPTSSSTGPLLVTYASSSSSGSITFVLKQPYSASLYLGIVTTIKVDKAIAVTGTIKAGKGPLSGGHADLQAGAEEYAFLRTFVPLAGRFTVDLTYDPETGHVTDITCASV